jgi:phenylpropionate dioxygenase-like ring-hydroxylating dioxygenase large terminal subunit
MPDGAQIGGGDAFSVRRDYIPRSDYVDPKIHALEAERLWPRVWQIACREEEIPNVGDYVTYEIVEDSILVVRSAPGEIRAFHNVCPHRGRRLRDDARGALSTFRCNYHAWRYGLDGRLIDRPSPEDWAGCPQMRDEDIALSAVQVGTWGGMVWINMDPEAEPLEAFLDPLPAKLDAFEFEHCRLAASWTVHVPANWKVVLEAFVEAYHVPGTHPQMLKFGHGVAPAAPEDFAQQRRHATHTTNRMHGPDPAGPYAKADTRTILHGQIEELHDTLGALFMEPALTAARRLLVELPEGTDAATVGETYWAFHKEEVIRSGARLPPRLTPADLWSTDWQIFPNSSLLPSLDGALWYRVRPDGTDDQACIFDIWVLGRYAPGQEPQVEQEVFASPEAFTGRSPFLEQDFKNLAAVQKGMRSRGWRGARPNPIQEVSVSNLHRVLHQYLYGEPR